MHAVSVTTLLVGLSLTLWSLGLPLGVRAQLPPGETPMLGDDHITQDAIASGRLSLEYIYRRGRSLAEDVGTYVMHCHTHAPAMNMDILILPQEVGAVRYVN